jgi:hypothetical protein
MYKIAKNYAKTPAKHKAIDALIAEIAPKLAAMLARKKVPGTLARGAAALRNRRHADVRKILDRLKDKYPAAAEMIRKSRYYENLGKGAKAMAKGDPKGALVWYKLAKKHAKRPVEREAIDDLIAEATKAIDGS